MTRFCVAAVLLVLASQGLSQEGTVPKDILTKKNPVSTSDAVLAKAKSAFEENCSSCHGSTGKGDGPMAGMLPKKPADLSDSKHVGEMTDGQMYWYVTKGYKPIMPPFESKLTDDERWGLVHLLRQLSNTKPNTTPHASH
jgi:mono/diheme cytochrome c family protein